MLDLLQVHFRTPSPLLTPATWRKSKTSSNAYEIGPQSKFWSASFTQSAVAVQQGFSQLAKGIKLVLHETLLMSSRIIEPHEQLATMIGRKACKSKKIQHINTTEYGAASAQVISEASSATQGSKKNRDSSDQERAQLALRRPGLCRNTGHSHRMCKRCRIDFRIESLCVIYSTVPLFNSDMVDDL